MKTPECNKLLKVKDESQSIGAFLNWLSVEKEYHLTTYVVENCNGYPRYLPVHRSIEEMLAEYFEIDMEKVEKERRKMIASLQKQNKQ